MRRTGVALASALVVGLIGSPATAGRSPEVEGAVVDCSAGTSCTITWDEPSEVTIFKGTAVDRIDRGAPGVAGSANTATISGLDATKRYYFELVREGAKTGTIVADRSLHLESAPNARDIGGYETKDGRHVKWGTVFRSDEISKLTDADTARMAGFGIKIVCDLRGPSEVESRGADKVPPGAELVSLPVFDPENDLADEIQTAITSRDFAAQERLLGDGHAEQILVDAGAFLVSSGPARKAYRALLDRLTDPASLPALTHCTAGKDRTGWSTAVILTALGVPRKTVIDDYLLTNELTKEKNERTIQQVTPLMQDPELLRPVLAVRPEYIAASFKEVKRKYRTFANYLRTGLDVTQADLARLESNLLTS